MGRRNTQGAVCIDKDKNTIRLRWRYQAERYSLNLFLYNRSNLLQAKRIALTIESDLVTGAFDYTLKQYKTLVAQVSHPHLFENCNSCTPAKETSRKKKSVVIEPQSGILKDFDRYLTAKSMDPLSGDLSSYYTQTRAMLKKWGDFDPEDTPVIRYTSPIVLTDTVLLAFKDSTAHYYIVGKWGPLIFTFPACSCTIPCPLGSQKSRQSCSKEKR